MTTWWWVRHGPTHEKSFVGWRDVPADLSDIAAVDRLRTYLPDAAGLVSSDLRRAVATADAIQGDDHVRFDHAPDLREFHFGKWDGLTFDQVVARDPTLSRRYWEEPGDITPPGGESWNDAGARVGAWVDEVNQQAKHTDIIAVAHIGVIMTQIQKASGVSALETIGHQIDNFSVTRLMWDGAVWDVKVINHLA